MILKRYNKNLRIDGNQVWSYRTHVATIDGDNLNQLDIGNDYSKAY